MDDGSVKKPMTEERYKKLEAAYEAVLDALYSPEGDDKSPLVPCLWREDPHLKDTPSRVAKAMLFELCSSLHLPEPRITTFHSEKVESMIILRDIPIKSLCAHHLLPFVGHATIGYIPSANNIIGLSKLSRIANWVARRPQVQEELTEQIADTVSKLVSPNYKTTAMLGGVGVVVQCNHFCMALRGVNHTGDMVTSALRGVFKKGNVRKEFLSLAKIT